MSAFRFQLSDGKSLIYETDPASLKWGDGSVVDLAPLNHQYVHVDWSDHKRPIFSPEEPIFGKDRAARRLKIQLGLGCNYSCSYCSQGNQRGKETLTATADATTFVQKLSTWLEGEPEKIELWGGEPLLYWKKIEILAPVLRYRYPNARILIITNGSLLTEAMVDFFDRWRISVAVSHDGPGQHLRGEDPFESEEWCRAVTWLFHKLDANASFNVVMTPGNTDMKAIIDWFRDRLGLPVKVNIEDPVAAYDGMSGNRFSRTQLGAMMSDTVNGITSGDALQVRSVVNKLNLFFEGIGASRPLDTMGQMCNMDSADFLAVDLAGNVLTCQNVGDASHKIGHVDDLDKVKLDTSRHFLTRPNCNACPVVHLCAGTCMFLDGESFETSCENSWHYNLAIIFGAIKLLTGLHVMDWDCEAPKRRVIPVKVAA